MSWRDRVNDLLYDGESVRETVDVGANRVYVTSHRVLAFPDASGGGSRTFGRSRTFGGWSGIIGGWSGIIGGWSRDDVTNFRHVDLPNVRGVTAGVDSDLRSLAKALAWGVCGVPFVVAGVLVEFGDWFSLPTSLQGDGAAAAGDAISLFESVFGALALLDEAIALAGVLFLVVAGAYAWRYARSREHVVVIDVAGDRDVRLPVDAGDDAAANDLRTAIRSV